MALVVKDALIRKRDGALPAGSSGFFVSVPSVFLFGLSDGDKVIGEIKIKEGEEKETGEKGKGKEKGTEIKITLILEKESGDSFLHIASEDWDTDFMGRADLRLEEAIHGDKRKQLYPKKDVTTSPAIGCRIS